MNLNRYLKKEVRSQGDIALVNRNQHFLQGDTIVLIWVAWHV